MAIVRGYYIEQGGLKSEKAAGHHEYFEVVNAAKMLLRNTSQPNIYGPFERRDLDSSYPMLRTVILYSDTPALDREYDFKSAMKLVYDRAKCNGPVSAELMISGKVSHFEILVCNKPGPKTAVIYDENGQKARVHYEYASDDPKSLKIMRIVAPPENPTRHDFIIGKELIFRLEAVTPADIKPKLLIGKEAAKRIDTAYQGLTLKRPPALNN